MLLSTHSLKIMNTEIYFIINNATTNYIYIYTQTIVNVNRKLKHSGKNFNLEASTKRHLKQTNVGKLRQN